MGLLIRSPSNWNDRKEHVIFGLLVLEIEILFSSACLCNPPAFLIICCFGAQQSKPQNRKGNEPLAKYNL